MPAKLIQHGEGVYHKYSTKALLGLKNSSVPPGSFHFTNMSVNSEKVSEQESKVGNKGKFFAPPQAKKWWACVSHCLFKTFCLSTKQSRSCETFHPYLSPKDWKGRRSPHSVTTHMFKEEELASSLLPESPLALLAVFPRTAKTLGLGSMSSIAACVGDQKSLRRQKKIVSFCMALGMGKHWGRCRGRSMSEGWGTARKNTRNIRETQKQLMVIVLEIVLGIVAHKIEQKSSWC